MTRPAAPFLEEPEDRKKSLVSRIARIRARIGPVSSPFDMKAFLDEEWEAPKGEFSETDLILVERIENLDVSRD